MERVENHPEQEELPIAEHGVIGNMYSTTPVVIGFQESNFFTLQNVVSTDTASFTLIHAPRIENGAGSSIVLICARARSKCLIL